MISIGTAGWSIPRAAAEAFPDAGSHLARYAAVLSCVEIDTSFHRPHRTTTYARWAATTPPSFRFAVKLPKTITHAGRLRDSEAPLVRFLDEVAGLGDKLAILLVQLPPSLMFESPVVEAFFECLRNRHAGAVACEPRHASWFTPEAERLLTRHRVARVATDPASTPLASRPGGWDDGPVYYRWHGSPRTYWSAYDEAWLAARACEIGSFVIDRDVWCIFDNTAAGAAIDDASRFAALVASIARR